jgi:hypothetical protein
MRCVDGTLRSCIITQHEAQFQRSGESEVCKRMKCFIVLGFRRAMKFTMRLLKSDGPIIDAIFPYNVLAIYVSEGPIFLVALWAEGPLCKPGTENGQDSFHWQ